MQDSSKTEKSAKVSRCYFCWGEETEEIGIVKSDSSFMEDSGKITKKKNAMAFCFAPRPIIIPVESRYLDFCRVIM